MDRLITLSRAFQSHHITADEFRQLFIEAVGTMTADDWLSLTYLFADAELDDVFDEHELTNTRPGGIRDSSEAPMLRGRPAVEAP